MQNNDSHDWYNQEYSKREVKRLNFWDKLPVIVGTLAVVVIALVCYFYFVKDDVHDKQSEYIIYVKKPK